MEAATQKRLYAIHLGRHVKGCVKGPVSAVPAKGFLFHVAPDGSHVVPDFASIRKCLPAQYRKAFDKSALSRLSCQSGNETTFHYHLHDTRGRYFNTVYAIGYDAKA